MRVPIITEEERKKAFALPKPQEVIEKQKLPVRYHVEDFDVDDRPRRFLEAFAAILKHTNYRLAMEHYVRVSAKCSRCTTNCQVYLATGDDKDIPCKRSELLLSVYRRHFTVSGILRGRLTGDLGLTDEQIQEMAKSFWDCTACRRCYFECPMGIDHGLVTHLGRYILSEIGIAPRALVVSTREQLIGATGNTSAIPVPALLDTLEFLSEDMEEEKGIDIPFPIDQEGAEYLFVPAVSDFLMEADTLMGNAAVFRATGDSWTIGTGYFDGINYGLFYSDHVLEKALQKIKAEGRGRTLEGEKDSDRRMRTRLQKRQVFLPHFLRRQKCPPGDEHHGIYPPGAEGGALKAGSQCRHRESDLSRSLQYLPSRVDRETAARNLESVLQERSARITWK